MLAQAPTEQTTAQTLSENPSEQTCEGISKATYMLKNLAIRFTYDPNAFVVDEVGASEVFDSLISSTNFWTKKDYVTRTNYANELGDFPEKLRLATYANPNGIPVIDWLSRADDSFGIDVENLSQEADTTVAGRDAWTFSYRSLFEYEGIAFQDEKGQMVLITVYNPPVDSTTEGYEDYLPTFQAMVESMEFVASTSE